MAIFANPTDLASRIANNEGIGRHRFGDNRAGTDESVFANFVATNDGSIGADGSTTAKYGRAIFIFARHGTARVDYVGKNHRRTEENIVLADDTGIDTYVVLYLYVTAKFDVG